MIKAIVDAAVRLALKRDLKAGEQTGLSLKDIAMAIKQEFLQNAPLDHTDALREITEDLRDKVIGIEKLHQGRK